MTDIQEWEADIDISDEEFADMMEIVEVEEV